MAGSLRYSDGSVTVSLDGSEMEAIVRRALDAAGGETLRMMEAAAEEVAANARSDWYAPGTGVTRKTGKSGDVQVVTTVSDTEVRVSVGSTDAEMVGSKPRAVLIHRPGRLSTRLVEITDAEYRRAKEQGGIPAKMVFRSRRDDPKKGVKKGLCYRSEHNPLASDGKFLVPALIRSPMSIKVKAIAPELARAIIKRAGG